MEACVQALTQALTDKQTEAARLQEQVRAGVVARAALEAEVDRLKANAGGSAAGASGSESKEAGSGEEMMDAVFRRARAMRVVAETSLERAERQARARAVIDAPVSDGEWALAERERLARQKKRAKDLEAGFLRMREALDRKKSDSWGSEGLGKRWNERR